MLDIYWFTQQKVKLLVAEIKVSCIADKWLISRGHTGVTVLQMFLCALISISDGSAIIAPCIRIFTRALTLQEINTELARRAAAELSARAQGRAVSDVSSLLRTGLRAEQGALGSALANVAVVLGFAAFAYTVKYVLRNIALE